MKEYSAGKFIINQSKFKGLQPMKTNLEIRDFLYLDDLALKDFQKRYFLDAVGSGKYQAAIVDKKTLKVRGLLWRLKGVTFRPDVRRTERL